MSCCDEGCLGHERVFSAERAERDLRTYLRRGPDATTRRLLEALRARGVAGRTLLDIGGGVGVIQHELLADGVAGVTAVDGAAASLAVARGEAVRRGHADRVRWLEGDYVRLVEEAGRADIVTLERVICCYPDVAALVGRSAAAASWLYGVVFPRDRWWIRAGGALVNAVQRLRGEAWRFRVHREDEVQRLVEAAGFRLAYRHRGWFWQVAVWERPRPA